MRQNSGRRLQALIRRAFYFEELSREEVVIVPVYDRTMRMCSSPEDLGDRSVTQVKDIRIRAMSKKRRRTHR